SHGVSVAKPLEATLELSMQTKTERLDRTTAKGPNDLLGNAFEVRAASNGAAVAVPAFIFAAGEPANKHVAPDA
ncbi:MAG: hypothetical protein AAFY27_05275, partial [Pseudomonadota bacterium]